MLSVRTESLENAEAVLRYEMLRLQEIEDWLRSVRMNLAMQGDRTFSEQKLLLSKQVAELEQEIEILNDLRKGLENISRLYMDCERQNITPKRSVSGQLLQIFDTSINMWDVITHITTIFAGGGNEYPKYKKSTVDETYDKWIRPMMG